MRTNAGTRRSACPALYRSGHPRVCHLCAQSWWRSSVISFQLRKRRGVNCHVPDQESLLVAAFSFGFGADGQGKREEVDEAFGVLRVVAAHGETGQVRAIEREGRLAARDAERALPEFESDGSGNTLLRNIKKTVEGLTLGREPDAVVDEFGVTHGEGLLQVRGFPVDGEAFEFAMRGDEQRAAGSFVSATGFHSDEAIFDEVGAADAVTGSDFVQSIQQINGTKFSFVDGDWSAGFETDFDFFGFVWSFFGRDGPLPHGFARGVGGIFEFSAFVAKVPDVAVTAVDVLFALLDWDVVLFGVCDGIFAGVDVPFAPRGDDLDVWRDRFVGQLEADLIVTLPRASVSETIGAEFERDFGLPLGDDWTRHGRTEQIGVFVYGPSAKGRPDEIADEFFAEVFDGRRGSASCESFLVRGLEIFLLADVAYHSDDFAAVIFLEPGDDDASVESAGIGEQDFFRFWSSSIHNSSFRFEIR